MCIVMKIPIDYALKQNPCDLFEVVDKVIGIKNAKPTEKRKATPQDMSKFII